MAAEHFARARVAEDFYVAAGLAHRQRLAVVVKRVTGDQIGPVRSAAVPLAEADAGHLRVGEHDHCVEAVVEAMLGAVGMRGIVRGDLALLDGDVDDLVFAVDIADGVDVGLAGAHGRIDDNAPTGDLDVRLV